MPSSLSNQLSSQDLAYAAESFGRFAAKRITPGVTSAQFNEIFALPEGSPHFALFDTDHNGKTDVLEVIACVIINSGASVSQKSKLCFELFDFDQSGSFSLEETVGFPMFFLLSALSHSALV